MRKLILMAALAGAAAIVTPAAATTFVWTGGNYISGTTSPNPLLSPDILSITTGSNKFFTGGVFTNQTGTVNWSNGNIFLQSGAAVTNQSLWDSQSDNGIFFNGGAATSFTNSGTLRKSAGTGITTIGQIGFINSGTIDAQTGTIRFGGGDSTFNAGSIFTGAGSVLVDTNAAFNGGFTSSNLRLAGGTQTGTAAALTGTAEWQAGNLAGSWSVTSGSTLNATTGSNKFVAGGTFANNGTVNWSNGNIFLQSGAAVTNNGTVDAQSDNGVFFNGGGAVSLVNNGLIKKTAGSGTTTIGNSIGFNNLGTVSVLSGTIALPNNFTNNGTLAGTGTFSVAGTLTNNGTIAAGNNGVGTLTQTGNYIQSAIGAFNAQLGAGTNSDLFNINGTAGLNGALNLFCASCAVQAGDIFTILDSVGNLSGTFASMTSSGFLNGFSYNILYDYGLDRVQVQVVNAGINPMGGVPEPASWALMIIGFGLVGAAMRRRAKVQIVTA